MSLEDKINDLVRAVAADQIAQDIENNAKFATKDEVSSGGADGAQILEQLIGFYNGFKGVDLDYRDYLDQVGSASLEAFYAFGRGYLEAAT